MSKRKPATIEELRASVERARLQAELRVMRSRRPRQRTSSPLQEGFGAFGSVVRNEPFRDGQGLSYFGTANVESHIAQPTDHRDGDNQPFWVAEQTHREIVGACRVLATTNEIVIGALEALTNYTVGDGCTISVDGEGPAVETIQKIVDDLIGSLGVAGERELFQAGRRDGDLFVRPWLNNGVPTADIIDPTMITEPASPRDIEDWAGLPGANWKYGIASTPNRPADVLGYWITHYGDPNDWEFLRPGELIHQKLNVARDVKRGMPDLWPVQAVFEGGAKLLENTIEGATVQAAIAFIREHAEGVGVGTIQDIVTEAADTTSTSSAGKTTNVKRYGPGTVHDVPNGMKYQAGPMGSPNGPRFIEVVQAAWRTGGVRWSLPEYMISGDASNSNFASTLVAESPMVKATLARQAIHCDTIKRLCWAAVTMVAARFPRYFAGASIGDLRRAVSINVTPPEIESRNRLEEHTIRQQENAAGILSLQTWAAEVGRDLDEERELIEPTPGVEPMAVGTGDAAAPAAVTDVADTAMNGAQVTAAMQIVQAVASWQIPRDSGIAQIQTFFRLSRAEAEAIIGSAGTGERPPPTAQLEESWRNYP